MKKLNNDSAIPLYQQVGAILQGEIKRGVYLNGDKIPSEPELCDLFAVSRITIRKAIEDLQEQGLLVKKRGKGTYVSYPIIVEASDADGSFTKSSELVNTVPSTEVVQIQTMLMKDIETVDLKDVFLEQDQLIVVDRVRKTDGQAMIYEIDYFFPHHDFILSADLENQPLMNIITTQTGIIANTFVDMFNVVLASEEIASKLNCKVGTPLLHIEQKVLTEEGSLIYFNEQYVRQDLYRYVVKSRR